MKHGSIAVVIPTIRPEMHAQFVKAWEPLFKKHDVRLITVWDGDEMFIEDSYYNPGKMAADFMMPDIVPLISPKCAASRNLGFAYVAKFCEEVEYIITLDDDEEPIGDPIQDHIDALNMRVPISWMSTTLIEQPTDYMRGFPYGVRTEAPVMVSHGVWRTNPDYDAPTQLLAGNREPAFYRGAIPKGVFFPFCGMNVAFRREVLPYVYYAPVAEFKGAERFDDIWAGLELKKDMDKLGYAIVTGYAVTNHMRASNVFKNLVNEAVGIGKNEGYWQGERDEWYEEFISKRAKWYDHCNRSV